MICAWAAGADSEAERGEEEEILFAPTPASLSRVEVTGNRFSLSAGKTAHPSIAFALLQLIHFTRVISRVKCISKPKTSPPHLRESFFSSFILRNFSFVAVVFAD